MSNPKISIIIPVYNVEQYLRRCLDSVINQTYQDMEIILVDDGSPDHCGVICDEYAHKDQRVRVIHKKNGGVSSARNTGLSAAAGEWIGWVDSDDWVELDMFERLLTEAEASGADIAVCGRSEEYPNRRIERAWKSYCKLGREEALKYLLENDIMQNFLWDKLWKRELFDGICFPEGRTYEDIAIMHRLFERASAVCCITDVKYHYFQRPSSIVSTSSLQNRINHYLAANERYMEMQNTWPQFEHLLSAQCVASSVNIWCSYLKNPKEERKIFDRQIKDISRFAKNHYKEALRYMNLGPTGRVVVCLTPYTNVMAFAIAAMMGWVYKKKHGREL